MKKIIYTNCAVVALGLALGGCGTLDTAASGGGAVVRSGVNVVSATGNAVVSTVGSGLDSLMGQRVSSHDRVVYKRQGVVYRNGHAYSVQNGRYVLVR